MTITNEQQQKLLKLKEDYKNKLPSKIKEINSLWQQLLQQSDPETITLFHRKLHSLHGTADTYGFMELGKKAATLETIAKSLLAEPSLLSAKKKEIENGLKELANTSTEESTASTNISETIAPSIDQKVIIYLLDTDTNWENNFVAQMRPFGYQIRVFSNVDEFIEGLNQQWPTILIINIDLVNEPLQTLLTVHTEQELEKKTPIIFTSTSGEFSLRLKAVRSGGEAFFVKPFLIEDLINQIDTLLKPDKTQYRILIIDDEMDVAIYNSTIIEQANMKTCIITKSNETDRALHEFNPDLILIDLLMPDCSGVELAKIIRQQSLFESTPIIYLSSETDQLKQLQAMRLGADDFLTKNTPSIYLIMTIRNRVERYKKLRSMMTKDNLTGLYNHSFILNQLELELKEMMQLHNPLSIALIDLDKFNHINETYGHQAGDHVFRSLGLMIRKRIQATDIVGRYSGEQFLVILPNTSSEAAKTMIDELRKQFLTINYSWNQQLFNASFSAGIASFPEFHSTSELLEAASESMAKSKRLGKNRTETAS